MDSPYISNVSNWQLLCSKFPKEEIIYFIQVVIIIIVVIACIVNLSIGDRTNDTLWSSMLSRCIGYLLPAPSIQKKHDQLQLGSPV